MTMRTARATGAAEDKSQGRIELVEVRDTLNGAIGWGRDRDEARAHAGLGPVAGTSEEFRNVFIADNPEPGDTYSTYACHQICDHFISEEFRNNLDDFCRERGFMLGIESLEIIERKMAAQNFASAVNDLFRNVFDCDVETSETV